MTGASEGTEHRRVIYFIVVTGSFRLCREKQGKGDLKTTYWGLLELTPQLPGLRWGHWLCPPGASPPRGFEGNSKGSVGGDGSGLGVQKR